MLVESLELPVPDELPIPGEPLVPDELPIPGEPLVPGRHRLLAPDERLGPAARVPGDRRNALAQVTATR
ncbi:hypothetical protein ACFZDJ_04415 [Streptomyces sp. NPDC007896]|uniref:hypothetical protein n=1 Tax=Streptomyces sp. NPDC007896 TaxID=3364784 RepID=UPI0036E4DB7F